jgi:hypothetical protein
MNLKDIWWKDVGWIHLVQGRDQLQAIVNTVMNQIVFQCHVVNLLNFNIDSQSSQNNLQ